jgi:CheY-like chemotaxis protein
MLNVKSVAENQKNWILYAEDIPGMRKLTEYYLKQNFEVESAVDGQEAFEIFIKDRNKYSLVLTDNDMPRCRGIDLIKRIRALNFSIPIIVYSGDEGLKQELLSAGADFFIYKNASANMKDIVEMIQSLFITKSI